MIRRILALAAKEFIHLRRDWWMPAFMVFGGVFELLLIGWATSRPITNLPLLVLDHDRTATSRELVRAIEHTTTFEVQGWIEGLDDIERGLEEGVINAGVVIPAGFEKELTHPEGNPAIKVLLNGAQSIAATAALRSLEGLAADLNQSVSLQRVNLSPDQLQGFFPSVRVWFNETLSEALYTVPAELALMLEFTVLVFAALAFAREREFGTLEQLLVMPFSSLEIIIGKSIPAVMIAFLDFVLMLSMVHLLFDIPVRGSLPLLMTVAVGYLMVELGKGLVISVRARTQQQAFLLVSLIGMTDFMFTGYAVPVESMPQAMQAFANLIPAYHWLAISRGILLKGVGIDVLLPHLLWLIGLGLVIGTLSVRYMRKALG